MANLLAIKPTTKDATMKATATKQRARMLAHVIADQAGSGQADAFGGVHHQEHVRAVQALTDAPLTVTRPQRAAGADGGLFDAAHRQCEMF
jgi:hypothetical protein